MTTMVFSWVCWLVCALHCVCLICIQGHTNNLAHPALSGLIINFFYTGATSVGQLFPEVFGVEVPRVTVAISATAVFYFVLFPLLTGSHWTHSRRLFLMRWHHRRARSVSGLAPTPPSTWPFLGWWQNVILPPYMPWRRSRSELSGQRLEGKSLDLEDICFANDVLATEWQRMT